MLDGVRLRDLSDEIREGLAIPPSVRGAIIAEIDPDSPAFKAGLRVGHIIVEINRKPVEDASQAEKAGSGVKPGEPVLLRVWSAGQSQFLAISPKRD
jgi:serine protease Do